MPEERAERASRLALVVAHGVARPTPEEVELYGSPVLAGCNGGCSNDPMEAARMAAEGCAPNYGGYGTPRNPGGIPNVPIDQITPDNCHRWGLRYVPIGASPHAAAVAGGALAFSVSPQAPFLPYMHILTPASEAQDTSWSSIFYGPTSMLIGGVIGGEIFAVTNNIGGYKLPGRFWITPGMTITYAGTALAAVAAGVLQMNCYGFTNAPG